MSEHYTDQESNAKAHSKEENQGHPDGVWKALRPFIIPMLGILGVYGEILLLCAEAQEHWDTLWFKIVATSFAVVSGFATRLIFITVAKWTHFLATFAGSVFSAVIFVALFASYFGDSMAKHRQVTAYGIAAFFSVFVLVPLWYTAHWWATRVLPHPSETPTTSPVQLDAKSTAPATTAPPTSPASQPSSSPATIPTTQSIDLHESNSWRLYQYYQTANILLDHFGRLQRLSKEVDEYDVNALMFSEPAAIAAHHEMRYIISGSLAASRRKYDDEFKFADAAYRELLGHWNELVQKNTGDEWKSIREAATKIIAILNHGSLDTSRGLSGIASAEDDNKIKMLLPRILEAGDTESIRSKAT